MHNYKDTAFSKTKKITRGYVSFCTLNWQVSFTCYGKRQLFLWFLFYLYRKGRGEERISKFLACRIASSASLGVATQCQLELGCEQRLCEPDRDRGWPGLSFGMGLRTLALPLGPMKTRLGLFHRGTQRWDHRSLGAVFYFNPNKS